MRRAATFALALASLSVAALTAVAPAEAACRKMGFVVNDYGKDGPTKDAQELLDKDIAKWAAGQGIAKYTVGKKDVTCELYLNLILFDEHTCTASATVCWDEKSPGKPAAAQDAKATGAAPAPSAKAEAEAGKAKEEKAANAPAAAKELNPMADAPPAASAKVEAVDAATPVEAQAVAAPVTAAKVETGAVPAKPAEAVEKIPADAVNAATGQGAAATPEKDPTQAAAAAAERAAAAAERAALAAERAAQAAMDAQQGQAAAGSSSPVVVQPVTPAAPN